MFDAMLVDHIGRLWISTADGLSCLEHGKFTRYTKSDGLPGNVIHTLLEDRAGKIWVGTWYGLAVFEGNHFHSYTKADGLPDTAISGLADDGHGGLWVGTFSGGLAHFAGGHFSSFTTKDGLPSNVIENVLSDGSGRLWVGTLSGTALLTGQGKFIEIPELRGESIRLYEDRGGNIWATTSKILARLAAGPRSRFEREEGPQDSGVVFQDRDGSFWIGAHGMGVVRYRPDPFQTYTTRDRLANNSVQTVFEDSKRQIWVGTAAGLSRWSNGNLEVIKSQQVRDVVIHSIAEDKRGRIWVGTALGISIFDGRTWREMRSRKQIPPEVHALYQDRANRMWIGSRNGIAIWDHGHLSRITHRDGLPDDYVMSLLEDHNGRMWIGTETGLARFDHGRISTFVIEGGTLSNYIQSLYEDSQGTLWICTASGLRRFKNGTFHSFSEKEGLSSGSVLQVIGDDYRHLWIDSFRGIFRINKDDLNAVADGTREAVEPISYSRGDGINGMMASVRGFQPVADKARNGMLWFPTEQGLVQLDPSELPLQPTPPAPILESMLQDGTAVVGSIQEASVHRVDFIFTAPTSIAPEEIEFRYKLEGYEDEWRDGGTKREVSFTNLPPGSYRFAVSARRRGGIWSTERIALPFEVLPHFYQALWFRFSASLIALILLWLAHLFGVRQREHRLKAVMEERSRVAQELHDTLLQSVSGVAMEIRGALGLLSRGEAGNGLQQLSLALAHMGKSMAEARQAIWDLRSPELREMRLDEALEIASERVCAGGPRLNCLVSGERKEVSEYLETHIYRIGVEAVTNAVRHSGCNEVIIELNYRQDSIVLQIRDNGCGFDVSQAKSGTLSNHWGLSGIKERAERCSGHLTIDSTLGVGTEVRFEAAYGASDR